MMILNGKSSKFPKKNSYRHTDILMLTVHCIQELGDTTPAEVAHRIYKSNWMHKESNSKGEKDLLRHVNNCWSKAKLELGEQGTKKDERKLSAPEKIERCLKFIQDTVTYDIFKNTYISNKTGQETTPVDLWKDYNYLKSKEQFIEIAYFDRLIESVDLPKLNPVKVWANNLPAPNKRLDVIKKLCTYIPAKNPAQLELYLKAWLIRTYIQSVNPFDKPAAEIVNRHFLILQSDIESSGKSSFLFWLSPNPDWVKVSGIEQGKDGKRAIAEYMIIIDDEMSGITQFKEHEAFKSLVSMPKVDVRLPYAKKDSILVRAASFCGSCNNAKLFPIGEQSTRFLCVPLEDKMFDYKGYMRNINKDLLWAQVKYMATETDWLEKNDAELRRLRGVTNETFERESMEMYAVETHFRLLEPTDIDTKVNQFGKELQPVLRTGDVMSLIKTLPHFKNVNLNLNVLGNAIRKKFGPAIMGYTIHALIINDKFSGYKYKITNKRAFGYPIWFAENTVEMEIKNIKKSRIRKGGYIS